MTLSSLINLNGRIYYFYYNPGKGVLCSEYNDRWCESRLILKTNKQRYSIRIINNEVIYLFAQNTQGDLCLCTNKGDEFINRVIIKNNGAADVSSTLVFPIIYNNHFRIIYNTDTELYVNNLDENGKWGDAINLDSFSFLRTYIFKVHYVSSKQALIFYKLANDRTLGYRSVSIDDVGDFVLIHDSNYKLMDLSVTTNNDEVHLAYIVRKAQTSQVIYKRKFNSHDISKSIFESSDIHSCILTLNEDVIYISFVIRNVVFFVYSRDRGITFSSLQRSSLNIFGLKKCSYIRLDCVVNELYVSSDEPCKIELVEEIHQGLKIFDSADDQLQVNNSKTMADKDISSKLDKYEEYIEECNMKIHEISKTLKEKECEIKDLEKLNKNFYEKSKMLEDQVIKLRSKETNSGLDFEKKLSEKQLELESVQKELTSHQLIVKEQKSKIYKLEKLLRKQKNQSHDETEIALLKNRITELEKHIKKES